MADYRKPYFKLFNGITDALSCLAVGNCRDSERILILAQQEGEELVISQPDPEDEVRGTRP